MANKIRFTLTEIVLIIVIIGLIIGIEINRGPKNNVKFLQEHLKTISTSAGKDLVVIFTSGSMYNTQGELLYFRDKILLSVLESKLKSEGYSIAILNTTCLAGNPNCIQEFADLAKAIVELDTKHIIYKGIDSGLAGEQFNLIIEDADIPLYTVGTPVNINTRTYIGPDNEGLGRVAFEGLKDLIQQGESAIYLETVRISNNEVRDLASVKNDNGFERIDSIRSKMTQAGVREQKTLFTQWSESKTYSDLIEEMRVNGVPDYIIAPSTETAKGAVAAVELLGVEDSVKIVALDYTVEVKNLIKKEKLYAGVSQSFIRQALYLVELINKNKESSNKKRLFVGEFITLDKILESNKTLW